MDFKKFIKKCAKTQNVLLIICSAVLVSILVLYTNCSVDHRGYHNPQRKGIAGYHPNNNPNQRYGNNIVKLDTIGQDARNFTNEIDGMINGIYLEYSGSSLIVYIDDRQDVSFDDDALVFTFNKVGSCTFSDSYGQLRIDTSGGYSARVTFSYPDDPNTIYNLGSMQQNMVQC